MGVRQGVQGARAGIKAVPCRYHGKYLAEIRERIRAKCEGECLGGVRQEYQRQYQGRCQGADTLDLM